MTFSLSVTFFPILKNIFSCKFSFLGKYETNVLSCLFLSYFFSDFFEKVIQFECMVSVELALTDNVY